MNRCTVMSFSSAFKYLTGIFSALVLVFASAGVSAGEKGEPKPGFTLTPMLGYLFFSDTDGLEDAASASVALGYQFDNPWAIEAAYLVAEPDAENSGVSGDYAQYRVDGLYHIYASKKLSHFLLIGAGQSSLDFNGLKNENAIVNYGAGFKYAFNDVFALRSDWRAIYDLEEKAHDIALNIGLQWKIGAGSKRPVKKMAKASPKDSDGDGVFDNVDNCPSTASGVSVDSRGCALASAPADDDNDGVTNADDACPDTQAGAKVDAKGCYIVISEDVTVKLNVNFANNSDEIVSGAEQIAEVAAFMRAHPLTKVVIEGHTDSMGAAEYNQSLSQKRADAVAAILVSKYGIGSGRVSAVGYGESRPVADNATAEGRAVNRRVSAVVSAKVQKQL